MGGSVTYTTGIGTVYGGHCYLHNRHRHGLKVALVPLLITGLISFYKYTVEHNVNMFKGKVSGTGTVVQVQVMFPSVKGTSYRKFTI